MTRRFWRPTGDAGRPHGTYGRIPEVGQLIAWISTRRPWRVLDVTDVHQANWTAPTVGEWKRLGEPDPETWDGRERAVMVEPPRHPAPNGKDRRGLRLSPWWQAGEQWRPLKDPFPVCVDCGRCWPCPCDDRNDETAKAMAEFERLAAILPGCCWACGQPIAGRQGSITFDGENLIMPGAGPATFHTAASRKSRRYGHTCRSEAQDYEDRWVTAEPGRKRRLTCTGRLWRHYGYSECTAPDCPGDDAGHSHREHCTSQVFRDSATHVYGMPDHPDEIRPPTNCGGRYCRGQRQPTDALTELDQEAR